MTSRKHRVETGWRQLIEQWVMNIFINPSDVSISRSCSFIDLSPNSSVERFMTR
jgi:hypothetical protein